MQENHSFLPTQRLGEKKQPVSLLALLMQEIANMRHVDEVLFWLATAMVQHLDIPIVQFWASQLDQKGKAHAELRAIASQRTSFPQPVAVNHQVVFLLDRLRQEQQHTASLPVESIFSAEQTSLLMGYGLHYWSCYFLEGEELLPPRPHASKGRVPTPLLLAVSSFLPTPFSEKQERAVSFLLEQSMRLIRSHKLLITPGTKPEEPEISLKFSEIVPRRSQNIEASQADNPFAHATVLTSKHVRRLYTAIDGHKTMSELLQNTALEENAGLEALLYLFQQQKIQLYTRAGEPVDASFFGPSLS